VARTPLEGLRHWRSAVCQTPQRPGGAGSAWPAGMACSAAFRSLLGWAVPTLGPVWRWFAC